MALLANGYRDTLGTVQRFGATASNNAYPSTLPGNYHRTAAIRNLTAGQGITDDKVGYPSGARHPVAWMMPQKAGALSSHNEAQGSSTATLSMASGINIAGQSDGISTALATLQLVVSMQGTAAGIATVTGNILAALGMSGTAAGTSTATGQKNALAWGVGVAAGTSTATLTSYATGQLVGTTEESGLTNTGIANSVWAALAAANNTAGTMGELLNSAGAGGATTDEIFNDLRFKALLTTGKFLALKE